MVQLKSLIDDTFYNHVLNLFDALGEIDQEVTRDFTTANKEAWQYITYSSLLNKMHKVFGVKNRFFARMLFSFLSDRKPITTHINLYMFIERLMPFWLKNAGDMMYSEDEILVEIFLIKERR